MEVGTTVVGQAETLQLWEDAAGLAAAIKPFAIDLKLHQMEARYRDSRDYTKKVGAFGLCRRGKDEAALEWGGGGEGKGNAIGRGGDVPQAAPGEGVLKRLPRLQRKDG